MKTKYLLLMVMALFGQFAIACPACEKQQPKITQGITHGAGPDSNWDWLIIGVIAAITVLTLIFSLKYLIRPGEKNKDHIKLSILSEFHDERR